MRIVFDWERRKAQTGMTVKQNKQSVDVADDDMLPEYELSDRPGERGK